MGQRRFLLILTSVIVVLLAVVIWFYPSSEDFRDENPFWNGLKTFTTHFDASPISSLDSLPSTPEGTTLVVIPQLKLTEPEMESLGNYLSSGGTLVILDDFGYGNDILNYLGLDIRFTQDPLLDPLFNYKNEWFPRITDFAPIPVTENVQSIVLNHATSLSNVPEADIIAQSSKFSYSDSNGNSTPDDEDLKGPLPVAAALDVDKGYLVLIADPSILINSMEEKDDNQIFIENILKIKDPNPEILVDQSHVLEANLDEAKLSLATIRSALSSPLGISIIVVVTLILTLNPLWRKKIKFTKNW